MKRVLVIHTIAYAAGIAAGHLLNIPPGPAFAAVLLMMIPLLIILWRRRQVQLLIVFSFFVGMCWGQVNEAQYRFFPCLPGESIALTGMAAGNPASSGSGESFLFKPFTLNGAAYRNPGKINVLAEGSGVRYGDVLVIEGKVLEDLIPSNPNQFNYASYLKRRGIAATVSTLYGGSIRFTGENRGNIFLKQVFDVKVKMKTVLEQLPQRQSAFVGGMLFGEKGSLTYRERNVLSETGLMDAFAVSGLHVGFVVLLAGSLAQMFGLNKWTRLLFVGAVLLFYAAVTGFTASVVRSSLMAAIGLWAYCLGETKDVYTALAAAALMILIFSPQSLFDAGFQLSFAAACGVIYLIPVTTEWIRAKSPWTRALAGAIAAQLAMAPLLAYYFNVLTVSGLVLGILVAGPVGLVILLGMVSMILCPFSVDLAVLPVYGAGLVVEMIWQAAHLIAEIPGSFFTVKTPTLAFLFFYYLFLLFFPFIYRRPKGRLKSTIAAVLLFVSLILPVGGSDDLSVTFVDVGQGDCIFIQGPSGRKVLIDGGGRSSFSTYDVGERIVIPYLKSLGIDSIDAVINTHPHDDHIKGLLPVVRDLDVRMIIVAAPFIEHPGTRELARLAGEKDVPVISVSMGEKIFIEPGITLKVLSPGKEMVPGEDAENDNSLVMMLTYRDISYLLTADAGKDTLAALEKKYPDLKAEVFKLSHHGSRTGFLPSFYECVSPRMVVICVGRNSFGHPSSEVVSYWQEKEVPVFRTDDHGAIIVSTDGKQFSVQTVKRSDADRSLDNCPESWDNLK